MPNTPHLTRANGPQAAFSADPALCGPETVAPVLSDSSVSDGHIEELEPATDILECVNADGSPASGAQVMVALLVGGSRPEDYTHRYWCRRLYRDRIPGRLKRSAGWDRFVVVAE